MADHEPHRGLSRTQRHYSSAGRPGPVAGAEPAPRPRQLRRHPGRPLHFREAVSALHDVVISDLRYQPKDRSAFETYLKELKKAKTPPPGGTGVHHRQGDGRVPRGTPQGIGKSLQQLQKVYWDARLKYSVFLQEHDPGLLRLVMPCDPVVTVAPDVLFFECFSADESSYACLTVQRDAFTAEQTWSSASPTSITPGRFTSTSRNCGATGKRTSPSTRPASRCRRRGRRSPRGEDRPAANWLRGFMQLQSAMSLPMRRVPLNREALYNLLSHLKGTRRGEPRGPCASSCAGPAGGDRAGAVRGTDRRSTTRRLRRPQRGSHSRLGPRPAAGIGPAAAAARRGGGLPAGTGLPSFWVMRMGTCG